MSKMEKQMQELEQNQKKLAKDSQNTKEAQQHGFSKFSRKSKTADPKIDQEEKQKPDQKSQKQTFYS